MCGPTEPAASRLRNFERERSIERREPGYDFEKAADQVRATAYPQAEALAVRYIVNPPTEDESLKMFAGSELT